MEGWNWRSTARQPTDAADEKAPVVCHTFAVREAGAAPGMFSAPRAATAASKLKAKHWRCVVQRARRLRLRSGYSRYLHAAAQQLAHAAAGAEDVARAARMSRAAWHVTCHRQRAALPAEFAVLASAARVSGGGVKGRSGGGAAYLSQFLWAGLPSTWQGHLLQSEQKLRWDQQSGARSHMRGSKPAAAAELAGVEGSGGLQQQQEQHGGDCSRAPLAD